LDTGSGGASSSGSLLPVAALDVEQVADAVRIGAASPAEVHAPERRGVAVPRQRDRCAIGVEVERRGDRGLTVAGGEAVRGPQLVADAEPLFFIRVDAIAPSGGDVLHAEVVVTALEPDLAARLAAVGRGLAAERVEVAARGAHRGTAVERCLVAADRQDDLVDLVARALVIDDGARAELGDGQEPRAAGGSRRSRPRRLRATGQPRRQRQRGKL
jgi:hypothetical protein